MQRAAFLKQIGQASIQHMHAQARMPEHTLTPPVIPQVLQLEAWFRAALARRMYARCKASATCLQRMIRRFGARDRFAKLLAPLADAPESELDVEIELQCRPSRINSEELFAQLDALLED